MTKNQDTRRSLHFAIKFLGGIIVLAGAALLLGGLYLMMLGGSWYYAIAGAGLVYSGWLVFRRELTGVWVYSAVFLFTLLWSLWEVGFSFWPLVPRLVAFIFVFAAVLLIFPLFSDGDYRAKHHRPYLLAGGGFAVAFVVYFIGMFWPHNYISQPTKLVAGKVSDTTKESGPNWTSWGKTGEGNRYAPFEQINRDNVAKLEVAWTARTGFIADQSKELQDQNTPLYVDGTLYQCAASSQVTAVDGVTGKIKWQFDPKAKSPSWKRCRTLGFFDPGPGDVCGPRVVLATVDMRLISLRTEDGKPCQSFGKSGTVDLSVGILQTTPADPLDQSKEQPPLSGYLAQTTGPFVASGKIMVGGWVSDNVSLGEPSGVVRAFDAKSGELAWAWDLGNPSTTGLPPNGQSYTKGTPNVWSGMAFDEKLNMVYLPLGNGTPDFYGGMRRPFDDEYNSAIVALDLGTGREVWHFRTVHHDIWDYDLPSQPALAEMPDGKGGVIPAIVQSTKRGEIFVLDRRNGKPIKPVEEKAAPKSDGTAQGERYAPTQPYSIGMHSIGADPLSEKRMWGATPFDQLACRIMFRQYRYDGQFTTQSTHKSLQFPGNGGGMNWGSLSIDQERNLIVAIDMRMPVVTHLIPRETYRKEHPNFNAHGHSPISPQLGLPYAHALTNFMSPLGIPCLEPPWGMITAVDLASGKMAWQHPTGTGRDVIFPGIGLQNPLPFYVGMPALGGPLTTKGGLAFHGGTQDYYLRAYDTENGKPLWEGRLPTGAQGTPMTYIGKDGRQYIVISAGGARYNPKDWGDYIIAFALPKTAGK